MCLVDLLLHEIGKLGNSFVVVVVSVFIKQMDTEIFILNVVIKSLEANSAAY